MPEGTPFEEYVKQEKKNRLYNELGDSEYDWSSFYKKKVQVLPETVTKYFEANNYKITPDTLREAMILSGQTEENTSAHIPDISYANIETHLDQFPPTFAHPTECVKSIADYIKAHMSYDLIVAMSCWDEVIRNTKAEEFKQFTSDIIQSAPLNVQQRNRILNMESREDMLAELSKLELYG